MRYIQPQVTGTFDAVSTINGGKIPPNVETQNVDLPSIAPAHPADE
jgi:hypothetical protein